VHRCCELGGNGFSTPGAAGAAVDELVKVGATDTTADYLASKVAAGAGIALATLNPGANEQLEVSCALAPVVPGGPAGAIQYNVAGSFGGSADLTWDDALKHYRNTADVVAWTAGGHFAPIWGAAGFRDYQLAGNSVDTGLGLVEIKQVEFRGALLAEIPGENFSIRYSQVAIQGNGFAASSACQIQNWTTLQLAGDGSPASQWIESGFQSVSFGGIGGPGAGSSWSATAFDTIALGLFGPPQILLTAVTQASQAPGRVLSWDGAQNVWIPPSADELVKVTGADTTAGNLAAKVVAGAGIALTTLNPGANEQLQISATGGPAAGDSGLRTCDFGDCNAQVALNTNALALVGTAWSNRSSLSVTRIVSFCDQAGAATNAYLALWEFIAANNYLLRAQTAAFPMATGLLDFALVAPWVLTPGRFYVAGVLFATAQNWQFRGFNKSGVPTAGGQPYASGLLNLTAPGVPSNCNGYNPQSGMPWVEVY